MEEAPRKRRFLDGVRERREKHLERNRIVRVVVAIFGFLVVLAGLAMLVLPGPGLLVIAIGLGILALEFVWAERLLERTVDKMEEAADAVKRSSRVQRALGVACWCWERPGSSRGRFSGTCRSSRLEALQKPWLQSSSGLALADPARLCRGRAGRCRVAAAFGPRWP